MPKSKENWENHCTWPMLYKEEINNHNDKRKLAMIMMTYDWVEHHAKTKGDLIHSVSKPEKLL